MMELWTKQPGAGVVMICTTLEQAIREMNISGCADVTSDVKEKIVGGSITLFNVGEIDHFDWEDHNSDTFWHIIRP